jgi:hypothetical protein
MLPRLRKSLLSHWKKHNRILTDREYSLKKGGFWCYDQIRGQSWWVQTKKFGCKLGNGNANALHLKGRTLRQLIRKRRINELNHSRR